LANHSKINIKLINDINKDIKNIAYILQYDTTYGKFNHKITAKGNQLRYNDKVIKYYNQTNIDQIDFKKEKIDLLIDSSGVAKNANILSNKKLCEYSIITHTIYNNKYIKPLVFGVNDENFNFQKNKVISSSICDAVAFAPIYQIIDHNFSIINGNLITMHPWLQYQNLLDGKSAQWSVPGDTNSHYALGRSAVQNLIPKSTSAVNAANLLIRGLKKKINSFSFRVPTGTVSSAILNLNVKKEISKTKLLKILKKYENLQKQKILKLNFEPLVSSDFIGEEFSAIIDVNHIGITDKFVSLTMWYDNEYGYSSKVIDIVNKIYNDIYITRS
jgi:glyceraldehyde 3-phosphate dehydrogenase